MTADLRIGLLGFGEVGQRLAADLRARGVTSMCVYDPKFSDSDSGPARALARHDAVRPAFIAREVADADWVISAVTAAEAVTAARSVQTALRGGAWYLDLNSVSPATRCEAAEIIAKGGGHYVEAAVMSAIEPLGMASPMLLGGPHAEFAEPLLARLGFSGATAFSAEFGRASATKMCRSVVVKGTEALLAEALLAARHYGVEQDVLDSLQDLFPADDWPSRARYMIGRSVLHGTRRAEEMHEVARTVQTAGVQPCMSRACADRQEWAAGFAGALRHETLAGMLDHILANAGCARP